MNFIRENFEISVALGIFVGSVLLGFLARGLLLRRLKALASLTPWQADDMLVDSLRRPLPLWFALAGLYAIARFVELPRDMEQIAGKVFAAIVILSITVWLSDVVIRLLALAGSRGRSQPAPVAGVIQIVMRASVLALGGLVLLSTFGISVTPVLTTVGIGGIAVALGLQDTLANLFAGMQITMAGNIRVGDFVKLESGEEGFVEDIRWRATRVRTLPNNSVVVPNGRLAQSIVTNYHLPSRDLAVLIQVGVHYASDLEKVETVTCEVARRIMKTTPGGVPEFEPFIRYHTFGSSSVDFTVILRAREFGDSFLVKHDFVKALARRYASEGIVIPFPIRAVNLDQEGAAQLLSEAAPRAARG